MLVPLKNVQSIQGYQFHRMAIRVNQTYLVYDDHFQTKPIVTWLEGIPPDNQQVPSKPVCQGSGKYTAT